MAVLVVSLLLNGLVLGAMAVRWWSLRSGPPWLGSSDNAHLFGLAVTLPESRHRELRGAVAGEREVMRPLRQKRWQARDEVRDALIANPFDAQRFAAAQKRLFEIEQQTRLGTLKVIEEIVQRLTPEERAALAQWENQDRVRRREFWRRLRERDKKSAQPGEIRPEAPATAGSLTTR
jgi:uncharacterized membrane protein